MKDTIEILLVEDNPADARLTSEALKVGLVDSRLTVARDGLEAVDFLFHRGKFAGETRPHLILLDLNLPKNPATKSWPRSRTTQTCAPFRSSS